MRDLYWTRSDARHCKRHGCRQIYSKRFRNVLKDRVCKAGSVVLRNAGRNAKSSWKRKREEKKESSPQVETQICSYISNTSGRASERYIEVARTTLEKSRLSRPVPWFTERRCHHNFLFLSFFAYFLQFFAIFSFIISLFAPENIVDNIICFNIIRVTRKIDPKRHMDKLASAAVHTLYKLYYRSTCL